jgi:hypothetical protein
VSGCAPGDCLGFQARVASAAKMTRTTFCFRLVPGAVFREEGEPSIEIRLFRGPYPADPDEAFQPLRLPDRAALHLNGPLWSALRRGRASASVRLRPGFFSLPLASGPPCFLEVRPETRVTAHLEVDCTLPGEVAVVRAADLHFSPPLAIRNILQTLSQVQELVDDRYVALLKALSPPWPSWFRELAELGLGSLDAAAVVFLEHASARLRPGPELTLRLGFSGKVRWLDQVETRFDDLVLPSSVLPVPHAALSRLFSGTPFATAELTGAWRDPLGLLRSWLEILDRIEGELALDLNLPPMRMSSCTIDGIEGGLTLRVPGSIEVLGGVRASVQGTRLSFETEGLRLLPGPKDKGVRLAARGTLTCDLSPGGRQAWERAALTMDLEIEDGSCWPEVLADLDARSALLAGESEIHLRASDLAVGGGVSLAMDSSEIRLWPGRPLSLSARIDTPRPLSARTARGELSADLSATLQASIAPGGDGTWQAEVRLASEIRGRSKTQVSSLPELDIHHGALCAELEGRIELALGPVLEFGAHNALRLDLAGSRARLILEKAELTLDGRRLTLPAQTLFGWQVNHGRLAPSGLQGLSVDVEWDLHGEPCLLHHGDLAVSLLTEDLRQGRLTLLVDDSGKITFAGNRDGLYGVRYFNALVNPGGDVEHLLDLFHSEDALTHVVGAIRVFHPALAEAVQDARALWLAARQIFTREGIRQPGDFVPRKVMARIFSLLLSGDLRWQERLTPILQGVTEGRGLDLRATREILQEELGEYDLDFELGALLHWLNLVLSPTEPVDPPQAEPEPPLAVDPAWAEARKGLPSAGEIYRAALEGALDAAWADRLAELAPLLTRAQLEFVLRHSQPSWRPRARARLRYVHEIKRRVEAIAEGYGGTEYLVQPWIVAGFLGEAVGPLPGIHASDDAPGSEVWPPPCALGPEEVAVLLQAGLAAGGHGRRTQLNNRLLLELMRREPPSFTRAVFVELGHQSPRALSGILYAFLDQDQDELATPIDLVDLLAEKLGIPIPRQRDYLAGGRKARQSYYEALSRVADQIIEEAPPYLARKAHLQVHRHPVPPELVLSPSLEMLEERARTAVHKADALGARCSFDRDDRGGPRQRAREAYQAAFRACAQLMQREQRAFQLPWFRAFWLRNEEALRVLSAVRNYQEDVDQVRRWYRVQTGRDGFQSEQELLEATVRVLYADPRHQEAVLSDPLTRLLLDPPPGRYRFSIVSCMGVITDGQDGKELVDAYRRLEERRGIRILRAHTGISRSLEYNARRIVEAIESCTTPWGIIGYSQGCANALMAESMLLGGTPDQQRLLSNLVCRNFLFSASNGSAHGSAGMLKFMRALVQGERYLKHYQALYSWEAIKAALRLVRTVLDSRPFIHMLGGAHSLSYERAVPLHRDGQFLDHVPTSVSRGVVTEDRLPEVLEWLYYCLKAQTRGAPQDTQVLVTDAVGGSTRVANENTRVLQRCDMLSYPLATHHWAPVTHEVEFVTTERDRELCVYEGPKDRLVWPWVEVNARFGRIPIE